MFHKELDRGEPGDNMGALLRGVKREQVKRGMVIIAPGSMKSVKKFQAQIYVRYLYHSKRSTYLTRKIIGSYQR